MKYKFDKDKLNTIVEESYSLRQVLLKLGMADAGGNYMTLNKKIKEYNIDITHLTGKGWNTGDNFRPFVKTIPLKDILVENSDYTNTSYLKNRLYKEGLKTRFCEECGHGEEWRGKRFSLILDHINGINNDHRLENLRVLCPNCNAVLDTHCGKNIYKFKTRNEEKIISIKKEKYEIKKLNNKNNCICGNEKCTNSKTCNTCTKLSKRKVERPPIFQLKEEIKELGYSGTGRKYGVSDNAIRKWIK